MELNKLNLIANAAAFNKAQAKEEKKEEEVQPKVDNKPAEKQCSADEVFSYMAGTTADFKIKVAKAGKEDGQEDRIAGFMVDFEAAFDAAKELGLSDEAAFKVLDRM